MANSEYGTFTKSTDTSVPAAQTVTLNNAGLTPKAVILWCTPDTSAGFASHKIISIGFSDGSTHGSVAAAADDNVTTTNSGRRQQNKVITIISDGTPTLIAEADVTSFSAGSFTLSWTTNNSSAYIIHYIALGSITNAKVLEKALGTATGNVGFTGAGFQPDCVLFLSAETDTTNASPMSTTHGPINLGAAVSSSKRWLCTAKDRDGDAMASFQSQNYQRTDSCYASLENNAATENSRADFVQMDSDGFTLNVINAASNAANEFYALCLKGGSIDLGNQAKTTGGNGASDTINLSFAPEAALLISFNQIATTNISSNSYLSIGGFDSAREGAIWGGMNTNNSPAEADRRTVTTKALTMNINSSTATDEADSGISGNSFTMTWSLEGGAARQYLWLAFGPVSGDYTQTFSDTLTLSDARTLEYGYWQGNGDSVVISDDSQRGISYLTTFDDNLNNWSDGQQFVWGFAIFGDDTLDNWLDGREILYSYLFSPTDTLDLSDVTNFNVSYLAGIGDALSILDTLSNVFGYLVTFEEDIDLTDATTILLEISGGGVVVKPFIDLGIRNAIHL